MRIVQIIDSVETGGAEKMAVNYANALSEKTEFSGLIVTRKEGLLLDQIKQNVKYLFLNKKKKIDLSAISKLMRYLNENEVDVIHAHSSSFFIAVLVKFAMPKIKIIWHDHFGISQNLSSRKDVILSICSVFFTGIISVNESLKNWAKNYLHCSNVIYFPNFICESSIVSESLQLKGEAGKRIVCVANLRPQKNHDLLLKAVARLYETYPDWTYHLVGKDFKDGYSVELRKRVNESKFSNKVFFYDAVKNVNEIIKNCDIAILTSLSEGLPLAVLEYGICGLPVVATNVGDVSKIIPSQQEGILIESGNVDQLENSIQKLIEDKNKRKEMGEALRVYVQRTFSEKAILSNYVLWLQSLTNFTV